MLVLTRKQNEKIRIGDNITITVVRMKGKSVRLGIEAPNDINVLRGELAFGAAVDDSNIHSPTTARGSTTDRGPTTDGVIDGVVHADQAASDTIIDYRIPRSSLDQMSH